MDAIRCPYCGKKRGFMRLFDAIGGIRTSRAGEVHRVVEESMGPLYDKHATVTAGAKNFEQLGTEAMEKTYEKATPEERATIKPFAGHMMPAASAMGAIPPGARQDSRELLYPALTARKVAPQWQN